MLNDIIESVSKEVGGSLISKLGLSKDQAEEALESTGVATMEVVTSQLTSGNISSVMNLFSNKPNNSEADGIQGQITGLISDKLTGKMGFSKDQIQGVISMVLPLAMKFITNKNEETPEDDSSPLKDIFGGAADKFIRGGAGSILGKLF